MDCKIFLHFFFFHVFFFALENEHKTVARTVAYAMVYTYLDSTPRHELLNTRQMHIESLTTTRLGSCYFHFLARYTHALQTYVPLKNDGPRNRRNFLIMNKHSHVQRSCCLKIAFFFVSSFFFEKTYNVAKIRLG